MKVRGYILAVIMAGLAFGPICADDTTVIVPSLDNEKSAETQAAQQTDNGTNDVKNVNKGPSTLQMVGLCAAVPVVAGLMFTTPFVASYVFDRSIVLAHEGGHVLAAWLAGKKITDFHVSSKFLGDGHMNYAPRGAGLKDIAVFLAGPLAGAAAYFAWAKLWEAGRRAFDGDEHRDMNLLAKLGSSIVAACGSFIHLKQNLTPESLNAYDPRSEAINVMAGCDGEKIRKTLAIISPALGVAYPYIVQAGLLAYAGYSVYRICQIYSEFRKEFDRQGKVNHEA